MNRRLILIFIPLLFTLTLFAQNNADDILGHYMSPEKNSIFKLYKEGDKYFGKMVWMKHPERLDTLNPDKTKHGQKILGSVIGWDFVYTGKNSWSKGYIYDANKGKIYRSHITRDKHGNLLVRGFIGVSAIGKTEYFVKVHFKE